MLSLCFVLGDEWKLDDERFESGLNEKFILSGLSAIQLTGDIPTNIEVWSEAFYSKSHAFRSSVVRVWVSLYPTLPYGTMYREEGKMMRSFQDSTQ